MNRKIGVRHLPFILLAVMTIVLITATLVEKSRGTSYVQEHWYGAWWFVALWGAVALSSLAVILKRQLFRRPATFLLHTAFLVILAGALTTHLTASKGTVHLRLDEAQDTFFDKAGSQPTIFPFQLRLRQFTVENYPGTQSPMDYVSVVDIVRHDSATETVTISMNHIARHDGYRFYQSGYDDDGNGTMLAVSHDPAGIAITYCGYAMLLVAMLLMMVLPGEGFRRLLKRKTVLTTLAILLSMGATAADTPATPRALSPEAAAEWGDLYVYYNGRICPFQTMARDFTTKLYGKPHYRGLTAEQVLTGWMLFPTDWISQPIIKIKGRVKEILGTKESLVAYTDFHDANGYRLESLVGDIHAGKEVAGTRDIMAADEKMNLLLMLFNGQATKIFPLRCGSRLQWLSPSDHLPDSLPKEQWFFIKKSMDYAGELAWTKQDSQLHELLQKIRRYQEKEAAGMLPGDTLFKAEKLYNQTEQTRLVAMVLLMVGLLSLIVYQWRWTHGRQPHRLLKLALAMIQIAALAYLLFTTVLRGYVSGHLPMANGFETMQLMALCALLVTLLARNRFVLLTPFGILVSGLTMLVSMMGEANPQITPLMPVLASPLLSLHVCVIMLAYTLLAFTTLNGITALTLLLTNRHTINSASEAVARLTHISQIILYPAVFCLAAGIFIGAVWANVSWGEYWSWDPKETWALVTMLIYAFPMHRSLHVDFSPQSRRHHLLFHLYLVLAFLSILMTYFGVNFFLGGMHSYA